MRPPRYCPCGQIVPAAQRCQCQRTATRERNARHDRRRKNASQRGYDRAWERAARSFLGEPSNRYCECGAPATLVRHVISIRRYPELRMVRSNWRPGCRRCNARDYLKERDQ